MIKYTPEQEKELFDSYMKANTVEERDELVVAFATKWQKPNRSIIAKLSKMGIYISKAKISKVTGNKPETKEQLVRKIETRFGVSDEEFMGLEKAPKLVLVALLKNQVVGPSCKKPN